MREKERKNTRTYFDVFACEFICAIFKITLYYKNKKSFLQLYKKHTHTRYNIAYYYYIALHCIEYNFIMNFLLTRRKETREKMNEHKKKNGKGKKNVYGLTVTCS